MPNSHEVMDLAHTIDVGCWVSYSGKARRFKSLMDARRTRAIEEATRIIARRPAPEPADPVQLTGGPIRYDVDHKGTIVLPPGAPFDGQPVLIRLASGWCEAWWDSEVVTSTLSGWQWICMDDKFRADLDDAKEWLPLPPATDHPGED